MTELLPIWLVPVCAAVCAAVLTPLVRRWLVRRNLVDLPDPRRLHTVPTPRGGGIAVIVAIIVTIVVAAFPGQWWFALTFLTVLGVLGWIDDRFDLLPILRLGVQTILAVLALWHVGAIDTVAIVGHAVSAPWLWTPLALIAAIWLFNLHNFMDGSDGLAAMQGVWSGLAMGVLLLDGEVAGAGVFGLAVAGAFGGFLVWNRPPARIFMGDVGSLALGGSFAFLALAGAATGAVSIWISFMVSSVFVVDATATLLVRAWRGERWYTAHRQHAYQRLIASGWSHAGVLLLYAAINVGVVLPGVVISVVYPQLDALVAAGIALLLTGGWWLAQSATITENERHE